MPRARTNEVGEDVVLPKTRARKPRAVSVSTDMKPVPRKRAPARARVPADAAATGARKAPTPLAARRQASSKNLKTFLVVLGACVVVAGGGVGVGLTDRGTIDVIAVVNERNEKISKGEVRDDLGNAVTQAIQVQADTRPNGGLPMGDAPTPPPEPSLPAVSTSTEALTTSEDATTTEESVESATTTEESV